MDAPNSALRAKLNGREWSIDVITRGRHFCIPSINPDVVRLIKRRHCQLTLASDDADSGVLLTRRAAVSTGMRDGMFGIEFPGQVGSGMSMLVFDTGRVFGTDTTGARYDGGYLYNGVNNSADVKIKVTFPPNVMAVFGIANPYEWSIDITATFNPKLDTGPIRLRNPAQADHRFQSNPISDSDASRSLIPVQADHQFRDEADQFSVGGGIKSAWIKPVASDAG